MADIAPIYEYAKLILGTDHTGHGFDHVKRVAAWPNRSLPKINCK